MTKKINSKLSKREMSIKLLKELLIHIERNHEQFSLIGHIIPDVGVSWRNSYPRFSNGDPIISDYNIIGDPDLNMIAEDRIKWLSKAHSLIQYTINYLESITNQDFNSKEIDILIVPKPPIIISTYLRKYSNSREMHLLIQLADECEKTSIIKCNRACAFYLRKILETGIKKYALAHNIPIEDENKKFIGLKSLIETLNQQLGKNLKDQLLSRKFLFEEAIHGDHNPSPIELKSSVDIIFLAFDKLSIFI